MCHGRSVAGVIFDAKISYKSADILLRSRRRTLPGSRRVEEICSSGVCFLVVMNGGARVINFALFLKLTDCVFVVRICVREKVIERRRGRGARRLETSRALKTKRKAQQHKQHHGLTSSLFNGVIIPKREIFR